MSRFSSREITDEYILDYFAKVKRRNDEVLAEFYKWKEWYYNLEPKKRERHKHLLRRKPYMLDPVPGLARYGKISEELMHKHKRILFNSKFRLESMLWAQEIPWDILKNYEKRIFKYIDVFEGVMEQFMYYGNVGEDFILENWSLIKKYIESKSEFDKEITIDLINAQKGYEDVKLLLKLNPIE